MHCVLKMHRYWGKKGNIYTVTSRWLKDCEKKSKQPQLAQATFEREKSWIFDKNAFRQLGEKSSTKRPCTTLCGTNDCLGSNKHGSWARNGNVRRNTFRNITYVWCDKHSTTKKHTHTPPLQMPTAQEQPASTWFSQRSTQGLQVYEWMLSSPYWMLIPRV